MHGTTRFEGSEVDSNKSYAVDQLDHQLFGFEIVAGCKDDGTGLVMREVLYPFHRHGTDRFNKPCANRLLSNNLAGRAPFQGVGSGFESQPTQASLIVILLGKQPKMSEPASPRGESDPSPQGFLPSRFGSQLSRHSGSSLSP